MLILTSPLEFPAFAEINVVLLNTLHNLHTEMIRIMSFITYRLKRWQWLAANSASVQEDGTVWITVKTTRFRWEAELMQQVLLAHDISTLMIDRGIEPYMGQGSSAALKVHVEDEQTARLLLDAWDGETEALK